MRRKALLLGTLGGSWAIIPELLGFTNPDDISLFAHRDDLDEISLAFPKIDEIWLATTLGHVAKNGIDKLRRWQSLIGSGSPPIRIWAPLGIADLTTQQETDLMREMIWRLALMASEQRGSENVCFCLAGGRKTMSSDLQQAATLFGASQLLHLIETATLSDQLRKPEPEIFAGELSKEDAMLFRPVIIGRDLNKAEILEFKGEKDGQTINSERFPIQMAPSNGEAFQVQLDNDLQKTIEERKKRARNLLFNYARTLGQTNVGQPFQALNVLPHFLIEKLKSDHIGIDKSKESQELAWLEKLPKTDLHCHLGGIANADDLVRIADAMSLDIDKGANPQLRDLQNEWRQVLLNRGPDHLKKVCCQSHKSIKGYLEQIARDTQTKLLSVNACFIKVFAGAPSLLDQFIFGEYLQAENFIETDIKNYEPLGDLQGSSLLQTEATIREVCRILIEKCRKENVRYIEVRCSPVNYTRGGLNEIEVVKIIQSELRKGAPEVNAGIIIIGSRHRKMSDCCRHVELATELLKNEDFDQRVPVVGFDLAGDEEFDAEAFAPFFRPLFEKCLHITVHAGETQSVESIWKAAYTLNAERIGHGLKLGRMPQLIDHFLDRGIAIEMCPSSNCQIVGFQDHFISATCDLEIYPLKEYLNRGLKVTVNTDNPGISRTNASLELHRAARMTPGGLSRWDILQLIKNGFSSAFISFSRRREILLQAEKEILTLIEKDYA
ncbi:MAG: CRISPR-associated ring nuclease [Candidatus Rifleibacteriota bacterium]